jgi:hypothetical protein
MSRKACRAGRVWNGAAMTLSRVDVGEGSLGMGVASDTQPASSHSTLSQYMRNTYGTYSRKDPSRHGDMKRFWMKGSEGRWSLRGAVSVGPTRHLHPEAPHGCLAAAWMVATPAWHEEYMFTRTTNAEYE